ncbi:MAG: hypothetical protein JWQ03_2535 [Variovorax sp.]|nr:hypothetical protein [Variovorax sp.]
MTRKLSAAAFLIALCAHLAPAGAQNAPGSSAPAWRCGNSYGDQPCKGGKTVAVDDRRSEGDLRAAQAATRRAELRGDELERSRLRQEREVAERDRRAAQAAHSAALAERRLASTERLQRAPATAGTHAAPDRDPLQKSVEDQGGRPPRPARRRQPCARGAASASGGASSVSGAA